MNQFTFTSKEKMFSIVLMALGVIATVWGMFVGEHNSERIWTNILHNTVFFTGIAFITLFLLAAHTSAYSGWHTAFKRVWESMYSFLIVGLIFIIIIVLGLVFDMHHLYHWAAEGITDPNSANYDALIDAKSPLLNKMGFAIGTAGLVAVWVFFGHKIRSLSVKEDEAGYKVTHKSIKFWSAAFMPIAGFSSFAVVLYLIMSVDPHWYSTLFAWYSTASWLVSAVCITILLLIYLKGKGYLPNVNETHFHDLGKYLFGFSIFWAYLWFSQYMLIWYANIGEETVYFQYRRDNFPVLFYVNLIINFSLPLLILVRNTSKRRMGIMAFMAGLLLFGHWLDFFLMIKPGVWHEMQAHAAHGHDTHEEGHSETITLGEAEAMFTGNKEEGEATHDEEGHNAAHGHSEGSVMGFHLPGGVEIGMMLGFLGLYLFVFFTSLTKASLLPKNDPYLDESEHHSYDVQGF